MARCRRSAGPPPPGRPGGDEFEVVQPGPPTYFTPPPVVKARGGLTPVGDGEGWVARPAPPLGRGPSRPAGPRDRWRDIPLRDFTVVLKGGSPGGVAETVQVRGHYLKWIRGRHRGECDGVFAVVQRGPTGKAIVALFRHDGVSAIFSGTSQAAVVDPVPAPDGAAKPAG